jgi:hypothetical protein
MLFLDVLEASNNWWKERKEKGAHHFIPRLAPFLFQVVESLYNQTRKLPLHHGMGSPNIEVSGSYVLTLSMVLSSDEYTTLRVILSLMADIYNILTPLRDNNQLLELSPFIDELYNHANKFREVRNFFTHMNEIFTNMDKHGLTGATNTNCGITYTASAKGCVHLVWYKNVLYFTYQKNAYEITIDRSVFEPIFQIARRIYSELISHKINAEKSQYKSVEELFPP